MIGEELIPMGEVIWKNNQGFNIQMLDYKIFTKKKLLNSQYVD